MEAEMMAYNFEGLILYEWFYWMLDAGCWLLDAGNWKVDYRRLFK
jgi:hypothetical protein